MTINASNAAIHAPAVSKADEGVSRALAARARLTRLVFGTDTPTAEQVEAAERHAAAIFSSMPRNPKANLRALAVRRRVARLLTAGEPA